MKQPGSLVWFAHHELRLAWRDWVWMLSGGRAGRTRKAVAAIVVFALILHLVAYATVSRFGDAWRHLDKETLVMITGSALLSWSLMISQALEQITRAFYARADLELILSSPASPRRIFAVRIAAIGLVTAAMACVLAGPFINMLAYSGGPQWLGIYGIAVAMGISATALALAITIGLFASVGPKMTRLMAQIIAAVIGAGFVIAIQMAAISSTGSFSRIAFLQSDAVLSRAPDLGSLFWWPARAMTGDGRALLGVLGTSVALLAVAIVLFSGSFRRYAIDTAAVGDQPVRRSRRIRAFRPGPATRILRRKEWTLLRRDPWLVSQSLMQILYLVPPAFLLWRNFGLKAGALLVVVPVLVMAAGQLAGGLAWLAISGEDAPDLVATAPVPAGLLQRAKIEAVMGSVALIFTPFILALLFASPVVALAAVAGIAVSAASATMIQLWFKAQAKRSHFRRRQTSSRLATFAEAFSSFTWAGAAALIAAETWVALVPIAIGAGILWLSRAMSPAGQRVAAGREAVAESFHASHISIPSNE